ncbi:MAG: hypothetical protein GF370_01010 [Candidatus Nealsonbacteria bacterium]|nr:hypothetical protein [Candidatus Nealsonbacteria bacterium]
MEKLDKKLIELANIVEEHGLGCILVKNPFRDDGELNHCFIITQKDVQRDSLNREDFMKGMEKARNECEARIKDCGTVLGFWGFGPVILIDSIAKWTTFIEEQGKHPVLLGQPLIKNTDIFLSKVIFGQENHGAIIRTFQKKYGEKFMQDCYQVYSRYLEERDRRHEAWNKKIKEEIEERKKILNSYEIQDIKTFLIFWLKEAKKHRISAIIGIERSGRPLAEMFYKLIKKVEYRPLPILDFLDPHQLRRSLKTKNNQEFVPKEFVEAFEREFPEVVRLLREDIDGVLFIDDQVFSFANTFVSINQLVKQVTGRDEDIQFTYLSGFNGYNAPSWWKNKDLLRIKSNEDCKRVTLRSVPREIGKGEEKKIIEFENRLDKIIEESLPL